MSNLVTYSLTSRLSYQANLDWSGLFGAAIYADFKSLKL